MKKRYTLFVVVWLCCLVVDVVGVRGVGCVIEIDGDRLYVVLDLMLGMYALHVQCVVPRSRSRATSQPPASVGASRSGTSALMVGFV